MVTMDKKTFGEIRRNIHSTTINKGPKMTKDHVKTAAEVWHKLEKDIYSSELNKD